MSGSGSGFCPDPNPHSRKKSDRDPDERIRIRNTGLQNIKCRYHLINTVGWFCGSGTFLNRLQLIFRPTKNILYNANTFCQTSYQTIIFSLFEFRCKMRFKNVEHIDLCVADIIHLFLHILFYLINMYLRFTVQEKM